MSQRIVAPVHPHRSVAEWWCYLWKNRPVTDETEFTREFREHGFGFALFTTWAGAIVGTINAVYHALFFKNHGPISQLLYGSYATPLYQALLESALLYWLVPLAFTTFKAWSRRYYQWVLVVAYTYYFAGLASQISNGYRTLDDANISSVLLIVFSVVFLRIPFKHVAILTITSTVVVGAIAVEYYGGEAFRLVITTTLSLVLSLYTSWRMEERDRSVFAKRIQAQKQHALAQEAAKEAEWQRSLAEQSAADADRHRSLAVEAAGGG